MSTNRPNNQPIVEQTFGEKLETWYDRNGKWINILIIVVLVGVIGYKGMQWMNDRNVMRANSAFLAAQTHYQTAQAQPENEQTVEQLQAAITAAQQVVNDYSDNSVGRQAQLMIANSQYAIVTAKNAQDVEQLEAAQASFNKYIEMARTDEERAAGHIGVGNVLENLAFVRDDKATLDKAVESYNKAADLAKGTALAGEAKLAAALAKSAMNNPEAQAEAKELYAEVAENRTVNLVSDDLLESVQEIPVTTGEPLSPEQVRDLYNMTAWSQHQVATDALAELK